MSAITCNAPITYRIRVEKRNKNGDTELIGDTGFIKPQTERLIRFLLQLLGLNEEELKERIKNGIQ